MNMVDHGMNVQMTTDAARFTHRQRSIVLAMEGPLEAIVGPALRAKGHNVRAVSGGAVGGYQGILFQKDPALAAPEFTAERIENDLPGNGVYRAGSDQRKDGAAVGW